MSIQESEPVIHRRIAWYSTVPQLAILFGLVVIFWTLVFPNDFVRASVYGTTLYLIYSFGSKAVFLRHHRKGIYLTKLGSFQSAIDSFNLSYDFLNRYRWLDKYRYVALLDSSAISYREMALVNIAFARAQLQDDVASLADYRRALSEFPNSELAKAGIDHFESHRTN